MDFFFLPHHAYIKLSLMRLLYEFISAISFVASSHYTSLLNKYVHIKLLRGRCGLSSASAYKRIADLKRVMVGGGVAHNDDKYVTKPQFTICLYYSIYNKCLLARA